jgi:hypothetical protein
MIPVRDLASQQGGITRLLASSDFLWDSMTELPDFYCSSIRDYKDNSEKIRDGRAALFEKLTYTPIGGDGRFKLSDQADEVEARLIYDISTMEAFLDGLRSPSTREVLAGLNSDDRMYDVHMVRKKGDFYVLGFDTKGPADYDSAQDSYLTFKFPQLVPVLGNV